MATKPKPGNTTRKPRTRQRGDIVRSARRWKRRRDHSTSADVRHGSRRGASERAGRSRNAVPGPKPDDRDDAREPVELQAGPPPPDATVSATPPHEVSAAPREAANAEPAHRSDAETGEQPRSIPSNPASKDPVPSEPVPGRVPETPAGSDLATTPAPHSSPPPDQPGAAAAPDADAAPPASPAPAAGEIPANDQRPSPSGPSPSGDANGQNDRAPHGIPDQNPSERGAGQRSEDRSAPLEASRPSRQTMSRRRRLAQRRRTRCRPRLAKPRMLNRPIAPMQRQANSRARSQVIRRRRIRCQVSRCRAAYRRPLPGPISATTPAPHSSPPPDQPGTAAAPDVNVAPPASPAPAAGEIPANDQWPSPSGPSPSDDTTGQNGRAPHIIPDQNPSERGAGQRSEDQIGSPESQPAVTANDVPAARICDRNSTAAIR